MSHSKVEPVTRRIPTPIGAISIAALAFSLASACGPKPADVLAETRGKLDDAAKLARDQHDARHAAVQDVAAKVHGRPDLGPCSATVAEPGAAPETTQVVTIAELPEHDSVVHTNFEAKRLAMMNEILSATSIDLPAAQRLLERTGEFAGPWPNDATLVVIERSEPKMDPERGFMPGLIEGRYVVWDYASKKFVCAAAVAATNAPDVLDRAYATDESRAKFLANPAEFLMADLMAGVWASAKANLGVASDTPLPGGNRPLPGPLDRGVPPAAAGIPSAPTAAAGAAPSAAATSGVAPSAAAPSGVAPSAAVPPTPTSAAAAPTGAPGGR